MAIVYQHKRNDTNEIFYIGKGVHTSRAWDNSRRNKHWYNIVNKVGYTYEILISDCSEEEAFQIEKYLIRYYGRKDLGFGNLVNMTDGGEGTSGRVYNHTDETKKLLSKLKTGCTTSRKGTKLPQYFRDALKVPKKFVPKKQCEYCNKITDHGNYSQWHGENCKHKPK